MENLKSYHIVKAAKIKIKFGECVRVEVENHVIFLPTRYNLLTEEELADLSSGNYHIKKENGSDEKSYQLYLDQYSLNTEYIVLQNSTYPVWK